MTVQTYIPNQSHFTIPIHFQLISCNIFSCNHSHIAICLCSWLIPSCHLPRSAFFSYTRLERYINDDAQGCQSFRLSSPSLWLTPSFHSMQRLKDSFLTTPPPLTHAAFPFAVSVTKDCLQTKGTKDGLVQGTTQHDMGNTREGKE